MPATRLPAELEFSFDGHFEGRAVIWHCRLTTLANIAHSTQQSAQRQFIEIHPPDDLQAAAPAVLNIDVALNITDLDSAAIEKTKIMIRNYKRLRYGRHEYGETYQLEVE